MIKRTNFLGKEWSRFELDRILLFFFLLLAGLMRLTHPFHNLIHYTQYILTGIQVIGILVVLGLSFTPSFDKKSLYYYILGFIALFGLDILVSLQMCDFDEIIKTGFFLYIIMVPWYMQSNRDLIVFQLANSLAIIFLFGSNPDLSSTTLSFVFIVLAINIFTYFIVGNQIRKTLNLSEKGFYYGRIIERLNDGILQLDEQGMIIMVNKKFCDIIGYDRDELVGKINISSMMSKENRRVLVRHLKDRKNEKGGTYEMKFTHKNGAALWLLLSITTQFAQSGNLKGSIAIVSDITSRKLAERELKQYAGNLRHSNHALESANTELEQFTQIAATDLKAPLLSMKTAISDIQNVCTTGEYDRGAGMISRLINGSKHMQELLDALWQYARSSSHNLDEERVVVGDIVNKLLQFSWVNFNGNVTIGKISDIHANVWQVERLFFHLIDNAIKFAKKEEKLQINITAKVNRETDMCEFCLEDNGVGIPKEYHEHIFLIFQKGPYQEKSGIGLGLPICKKIIENHHGTIRIDSIPDQGTKVFFSLPVHKKTEIEPLLS